MCQIDQEARESLESSQVAKMALLRQDQSVDGTWNGASRRPRKHVKNRLPPLHAMLCVPDRLISTSNVTEKANVQRIARADSPTSRCWPQSQAHSRLQSRSHPISGRWR